MAARATTFYAEAVRRGGRGRVWRCPGGGPGRPRAARRRPSSTAHGPSPSAPSRSSGQHLAVGHVGRDLVADGDRWRGGRPRRPGAAPPPASSCSSGTAPARSKPPTAVRRRFRRWAPPPSAVPMSAASVADVGAARARDGQPEHPGLVVPVDRQRVDGDRPGLALDLHALAGQLVEAPPVDLHRRHHRRHLQDRPDERHRRRGARRRGSRRPCRGCGPPRRRRRASRSRCRARSRRRRPSAGRRGSAAAGWPARRRARARRWPTGRGCRSGRPSSCPAGRGSWPRRRGRSSRPACRRRRPRRAVSRPAGRRGSRRTCFDAIGGAHDRVGDEGELRGALEAGLAADRALQARAQLGERLAQDVVLVGLAQGVDVDHGVAQVGIALDRGDRDQSRRSSSIRSSASARISRSSSLTRAMRG